jgi:hypothetical protein
MVLFLGDFVLEGIVLKVLISQLLRRIHIFKLFHWREHSLMWKHEGVFSSEAGRALVVPQIHSEVHRRLREVFIDHVREFARITFVVNIASDHGSYWHPWLTTAQHPAILWSLWSYLTASVQLGIAECLVNVHEFTVRLYIIVQHVSAIHVHRLHQHPLPVLSRVNGLVKFLLLLDHIIWEKRWWSPLLISLISSFRVYSFSKGIDQVDIMERTQIFVS